MEHIESLHRSARRRRWRVAFVTAGVVVLVTAGPTMGSATAAPPTTTIPPDTTSPPPTTVPPTSDQGIPLTMSPVPRMLKPLTGDVPPGGTYTVSSTACGTGWTVTALLTRIGDDIGMTPDGNNAEAPIPVEVQQTDAGFTLTRQARMVTFPTMTIFGDVGGNSGLTAWESLEITCRSGDVVLHDFAAVGIERVDEFPGAGFDAVADKGDPPCQFCVGIIRFLGWGIKASRCTVGSIATLSARSSQVAPRELTATIESNQWAHFADPLLWDQFGQTPRSSTRFTVTCQGPDGTHTVTLRATTVSSAAASTSLPGTGSAPASVVVLAALLILAGVFARRASVRRT